MNSTFITKMNLKFIKEENVTVPSGEFDTYKIQFASTNQISNIIYVNKEKPFNIVKVEIVGNPLEMVLVNSQSISKN